jgi:4-amino-4-deoxy-L-arabinose transferase-like glycosyltransferase
MPKVLVLVAFGLRLAWLLASQPEPVSDFLTYRRLAFGLLEHGQLGYPVSTAGRLPGYPVFLAMFAAISENDVWLGVGSVLLSTALVPLTHVLMQRLGAAPRVALLGTALVAFNPTFVLSAPLLASEHLSTLLVLGAIVLSLQTDPAKFPWPAFASGLLLGLAALTRGDALLYILVLGFIVARKGPVRPRVVASGALLLGTFLCLTPWYARNRLVVGPGTGLSTTSGFNFYAAHNDKGYGWSSANKRLRKIKDPVARNRHGWQLGLDHLKQTHVIGLAKSVARGTERLYFHPPDYPVKWSTKKSNTGAERLKAPLEVLVSVVYYPLFLLALLAYRWWRSAARPVLALGSAVVLINWFTFAVLFWGKPRYRFLGETVFCLMAAVTLDKILVWLETKRAGEASPPPP